MVPESWVPFPADNPIRSLPPMSAVRGRIDYPATPSVPYRRPTGWRKYRNRIKRKVAAFRYRLALWIDPSLRPRPWD